VGAGRAPPGRGGLPPGRGRGFPGGPSWQQQVVAKGWGYAIIVPNSQLITTPVINQSSPTSVKRVTVNVGVAYGSDVELVKSTLLTVGAYTWFTIWTTERRQKYRLNANLADDEASGVQIDSVTNIETVKYFNNELLRERQFGKAIQRWYALSVRSNRLFAAITAGNLLVTVCLPSSRRRSTVIVLAAKSIAVIFATEPSKGQPSFRAT